MPPRRRARLDPPDAAGLDRDGQEVARRPAARDDPWGEPTVIRKTWAESFEDPEAVHRDPSAPNGPDYWFRAEVEGVDFDIHFRLGRTDEGGLVITGLLLGDPGGTQPITTANLHRLPLGAIYESVSDLDNLTTTLAQKAKRFKGEIPSRGGQRTPDEQFKDAAELYKQCLIERPNDPIKCVAEKLGVSSATASRRVSRARDLGLLSREQPRVAELRRHRDYLEERVVDIERAFAECDPRTEHDKREEIKSRLAYALKTIARINDELRAIETPAAAAVSAKREEIVHELAKKAATRIEQLQAAKDFDAIVTLNGDDPAYHKAGQRLHKLLVSKGVPRDIFMWERTTHD